MGRKLIHQKLPCAQCGALFFTRGRAGARFCSMPCKRASTEQAKDRVCACCGRHFQDFTSTRNSETCSAECRLTHFSGENSKSFKGGRYIDCNGYVVVRIGRGAYRRLHRIVAEQVLGRSLLRNELVLFVDGVKSNCAASNLHVCTVSELRANEAAGLRPKLSNLEPLTYQNPSERGSRVEVQESWTPATTDRPPVGPWHNGRAQWLADAPANVTTPKAVNAPMRSYIGPSRRGASE